MQLFSIFSDRRKRNSLSQLLLFLLFAGAFVDASGIDEKQVASHNMSSKSTDSLFIIALVIVVLLFSGVFYFRGKRIEELEEVNQIIVQRFQRAQAALPRQQLTLEQLAAKYGYADVKVDAKAIEHGNREGLEPFLIVDEKAELQSSNNARHTALNTKVEVLIKKLQADATVAKEGDDTLEITKRLAALKKGLEKIKGEYFCSITCSLYEHPVTVRGHNYEAKDLLLWVANGNYTSPNNSDFLLGAELVAEMPAAGLKQQLEAADTPVKKQLFFQYLNKIMGLKVNTHIKNALQEALHKCEQEFLGIKNKIAPDLSTSAAAPSSASSSAVQKSYEGLRKRARDESLVAEGVSPAAVPPAPAPAAAPPAPK